MKKVLMILVVAVSMVLLSGCPSGTRNNPVETTNDTLNVVVDSVLNVKMEVETLEQHLDSLNVVE